MYEINKTYETPKGLIKILSRTKKQNLPNGKVKHPRAVIQFVKTGTVIDVQTCNIKAGKFEDFMEPFLMVKSNILGLSFSLSRLEQSSMFRPATLRQVSLRILWNLQFMV